MTALRRGEQAKPFGDRYGFCERANLKLLHDIMPVCLDGPLRCPKLESNYFVELAADDQGKNLALARCESRHQGAQRVKPLAVFAPVLIARQRPPEGFE